MSDQFRSRRCLWNEWRWNLTHKFSVAFECLFEIISHVINLIPVSKLIGPGIGDFIVVVVPPGLLTPPVELNCWWCEPPCESFKTSKDNQVDESVGEVFAAITTGLKAADHEGKGCPESEDPGEGDGPCYSSVVKSLEDSAILANVGEKPESGSDAKVNAASNSEDLPCVPGAFSHVPPVAVGGVHDGWKDWENEPGHSKSNSLVAFVGVEEGGVEVVTFGSSIDWIHAFVINN